MSDGVFEAVRQVLTATIPNPKTALMQNIAEQIRITRGFRQAEQKSWDQADIEVGHMQFAAVKLEQALNRLKRIPSAEAVGLKRAHDLRMEREQTTWLLDLERIKREIETRTKSLGNKATGNKEQGKYGGAPKQLSPKHMGLAVMGALKRGDVPMRNWRTLTAQLLEETGALSQSKATTGARYAREWMTKTNAE